MCSGFFYHFSQLLRIFKHRAWTVHIVIKRLSVMICHHHRRLQCFQKCFLADIGIRIMDKYTWIDITICIDMQITTAACNTSSHKLCIILEIHGKQRLCCTVFTDTLIGFSSLCRSRKQLRCCIISNRHIMEIPDKVRSKIDQAVVKCL